MGMDCEDALISSVMPSQIISSWQRRVDIPHTVDNTWTVLGPTSQEQLDLQSSHFSGSYNRM